MPTDSAAPKAERARPRRARAPKLPNKHDRRRMELRMRGGRITLLILGLLHLAVGSLYFFVAPSFLGSPAEDASPMAHYLEVLLVTGFLLPGILLAVLFVLARQKPLFAAAGGLAVYLGFLGLYLFLNPMSLVSPIAWGFRIGILIALFTGLNSARAWHRLQAQEAALAESEPGAEAA